MLTAERLHEVLHYDQETGIFTWLVQLSNRALAGSRAGCVRADGYRRVRVDKGLYRAGRLAWFYVNGTWPPNFVDHENLDRSDDRWLNLRSATVSQNGANTPRRRDNVSGARGVHWNKQSRKWIAQIQHRHLGTFETKDAAIECYQTAANAAFGEFARIA